MIWDLQGVGATCSTTGCDIDLFFGLAALALQVHSRGGYIAWLILWNTWEESFENLDALNQYNYTGKMIKLLNKITRN